MKHLKKAQGVPHLFSKLIVAYCVFFASLCSLRALGILERTGNDTASLLGVILGFFGGELLFLCMRSLLKKEDKSDGDS